jgi:integrase/recombinase XerD
MTPEAQIVLDTRYKHETGKYAVKIRIGWRVFKKEKDVIEYKYYPANDTMFEKEFDKLYTAPALEERKKLLEELKEKANSIIKARPTITHSEFEGMFNGKGEFKTIQGILEILKAEADTNDQIKTSGLQNTTANNLTRFAIEEAKKKGHESDGKIAITDVTPELLQKFEDWCLARKKPLSYNTIGVYARYIRSAFNYAIRKGLARKEWYPFGRGGYIPPATTGRKIALTESIKNKLLHYQSSDPIRQRAADFWVLSFLTFGLNMKDILSIRQKNITESTGIRVIKLFRSKTFLRKRFKEEQEIPVTERIMQIILKYGKLSLDPNAYVFPVLENAKTPKELFNLNESFLDRIGEGLVLVAEDLEIPKLQFSYARHTFAYIMKIKGTKPTMIQKMLGHDQLKTTEIYMEGFEVQDKLAAAQALYS